MDKLDYEAESRLLTDAKLETRRNIYKELLEKEKWQFQMQNKDQKSTGQYMVTRTQDFYMESSITTKRKSHQWDLD